MDNTGRIKKGLNRSIKKIIFGNKINKNDKRELLLLSTIDKAHIVMLEQEGFLSFEYASKVISKIVYLENLEFRPLIGSKTPRGLYMKYENWLIEQLGIRVAGSIHLGRSRNDINATIAMIQMRENVAEVVTLLLKFVELLNTLSMEYKDVVMPAYTHHQPAVPITYGYYLQGVCIAMKKNINQFLSILDSLKTSPLGSCSVGGTSVAINSKMTSKLLGFDSGPLNAMEAVASRDYVLNFMSIISITSVLISRIATDLLLWNTREFNFFKLDDQITGSSSIMPNKKNPFILENIQGKTGVISSSLFGAVTAMHNTPFTNNIGVGTESNMFLDKSKNEFLDSLELLTVFMQYSKPNVKQMKKKSSESFILATEYANTLVLNHNIPFREAHFTIGKAISNSSENIALTKSKELEKYKLEISLEEVVSKTKYGGGPSCYNVENNFNTLKKYISKTTNALMRYKSKWETAYNQLTHASNKLVKPLASKV